MQSLSGSDRGEIAARSSRQDLTTNRPLTADDREMLAPYQRADYTVE